MTTAAPSAEATGGARSPSPATTAAGPAGDPTPTLPREAEKGPAATPAGFAPASTPAQAGAATALSADQEAELAQLVGGAGSAAEQEQPIRLYGFADFTYGAWVIPDGTKWDGFVNRDHTFYVGNLNVYMDAQPGAGFRSLVEVRYLFLPNGTQEDYSKSLQDPISDRGRYDTTTFDYNDINRPLSWGGIQIARAQLDYTVSSYLRLRGGRFLTPWGIWNVDHGSPVLIGVRKPYVIGEALFPEAQTGLEAFGSAPLGDSTTLAYHLTLSNGRGPIEQYEDMDANKALGGRLVVSHVGTGALDVGASFYKGTVTDKRQEIASISGSIPTLKFFNYAKYRELSLAVDLRWIWKSLHVQGEAALHDRAYDDNARPPTTAILSNPKGTEPDSRRVGAYGLLAYRFPWFQLMPYAIISYYNIGQRARLYGSRDAWVYSGGINWRPTPSVVLKAEWGYARWPHPLPGSWAEDPVSRLEIQAAWAF